MPADDCYRKLRAALHKTIPKPRLIDDPLRTFAYGTDASVYRMVPKLVVKAANETEVATILTETGRLGLPVTFRAAGTSLSGQAISDSVLVVAGADWHRHTIVDNGQAIRLQPGVIGGQANQWLAPYGRKIGPDPASINAAMIGGIAANNASGMCCGVAQNSYHTVRSIRIVMEDGTVLDTGDSASREAFRQSHGDLLNRLADLGLRVRGDAALSDRIKKKYRIKNTMGFSLNALVDYTDPFDILTHIMIGSEGTLAFISEIVYDTVADPRHKASALMVFPTIEGACGAVGLLEKQAVAAAEIMDRAALQSVADKPGMPPDLNSYGPMATALLVEVRSDSPEDLQSRVEAVTGVLDCIPTVVPIRFADGAHLPVDTPYVCTTTESIVAFTDDPDEYTRFWNVRKGLFPAVGAVRRPGTAVVIEDVAFPLDALAEATMALQNLFERHQYHEAIIFGHALAGNLHFVFTQDFSETTEVDRYRRFMDDVCDMVVTRFDGSLKGEHSTGRNMAPYLELEWGSTAVTLMREIKDIFDPNNRLNPGVILNDAPDAHVQNLKAMAPTDPLVDTCIECGFCEVHCPSRNLTLTPRQRIVVQREMARLQQTCTDPDRLAALAKAYDYDGEQTCAADGMCATACPVGINTGTFTRHLRHRAVGARWRQWLADQTADHFAATASAARFGLRAAHWAHSIIGTGIMSGICKSARAISGGRLPLWNPSMPRGIAGPTAGPIADSGTDTVVYFPACVSRTMGPAKGDPDPTPQHAVIEAILARAGYKVVFPEGLSQLCCGTPFESKGFFAQADRKSDQLEAALAAASDQGRHPILVDTGPCLDRMKRVFSDNLTLFDSVAFIHDFLLERLPLKPVPDPIGLHISCSARKQGLTDTFETIARACADHVVIPERIECCGFAGDRGFSHPELNASALSPLRDAVAGCTAGYSNSRTCEIGLSLHSGLYYKSIFYLLDKASRS